MKSLILFISFFIGFSTAAFAQSEPPYDMGHREAYAVFSDAIKNNDYEMAVKFGVWMLEAKPKELEGHSSFSLDRQFERLINVYGSMAGNEKDPVQKKKYLQKALDIYDLAFETFSDDEIDTFRWNYKKGRFYQDHRKDIDGGLQKAFELYEKTYQMDPQRFTEMGEGYFAQLLLTHYTSVGEKAKALSMIDEIGGEAPAGLQEVIAKTKDVFYNSPEEKTMLLESRLTDADSDEREKLLARLIDLYHETGQNEKSFETALELYKMNPDYRNTRIIADVHLSRGDYRNALDYLQQLPDKSPSNEERKEATLEIAETYQLLGNLRSAREYAREAIQMDREWGASYIRMAAIYASAVTECTEGRKLDRNDRTVYWLVLDYLEKAKETDPSVQTAADRRINSFIPVLPNSEDKFFRGWEEGDNLRINGEIRQCYAWIDETVTVR